MKGISLRRAARCLALIGVGACSPPAAPSRAGDWPVYGGDQGAMQYTTLSEIDRGNVDGLEVAWEWATGEEPAPGPRQPIPGQDVRPGAFENTPLVIHDTMIVTTPYNRVVALDAGSGEELWSFDPQTIQWGQPPNGTGLVHRGVAVWTSNATMFPGGPRS